MNIHSIKFKLILFSLFLLIIPLLITVTIVYTWSSQIILQLLYQSSTNDIKHVRLNIDSVLSNVQNNLSPFMTDMEMKRILNERVDIKTDEYYIKNLPILKLISNMENSSLWIDSIYIYDINDNLLLNSDSSSIILNTDFPNNAIYKEVINKGRVLEWIPNIRQEPMYTVVNDRLITFSMPIKLFTQNVEIGYVFLNVNERTLFKYIQQMNPEFPEEFAVTNQHGEILSHKDKKWFGKTIEEYLNENQNIVPLSFRFKNRLKKKSTFFISQNSKDTTLSYYSFTPVQFFSKDINYLKKSTLLFGTIIILATLFLILRLIKGFCIPISRLVDALQDMTIGKEKEIKIAEKRKDEFGLLYDSYNKTVDRIDSVFHDLLNEKIRAKTAEIKFLQAQINPHLLYNTLNSIYCISKIYNVKDIMDLSSALSNFYRLSLSGGQDCISIKDIIEHIRLYVQIQNIRMNNRIKLEVYIEEALLDIKILKLLHQPLIENSITHGLKENGEDLNITFRFNFSEDALEFTIDDNGKGLPPEEIEEINKRLKDMKEKEDNDDHDFFALQNIHSRIQIYYGQRYGIHLENSNEGGIRVKMTLPALFT